MSSLAYTLRDSTTMLRRDVRHSKRYPMVALSGIGMPAFFLLLFVGIFGKSLRAGIVPYVGPGGHYVDYLTPGILVMVAAATAEVTAVSVCTDMSEGIINRFRTMAVSRLSVLTGQVLGSLIRTLLSAVLVVAIALALGFRSHASPVAWLPTIGVFVLATLALTWLAVAFGLYAKTPAGANSLALLLVVLPFVSSAFVPTASMPPGVRWFAQYQPFTAVIQTLRGLLTGSGIGWYGTGAVAWSAAIALAGYLWARYLYDRGPRPQLNK
jgi:ABC-2 type transport system permease protein